MSWEELWLPSTSSSAASSSNPSMSSSSQPPSTSSSTSQPNLLSYLTSKSALPSPTRNPLSSLPSPCPHPSPSHSPHASLSHSYPAPSPSPSTSFRDGETEVRRDDRYHHRSRYALNPSPSLSAPLSFFLLPYLSFHPLFQPDR
jgi:hypothetical protein